MMARGFRREFVLWGALLLFLFAIGYARGSKPNWSWSALFPAREPIVLLTSDRAWVPASLIDRLTKDLEREIHVEVVEEYADLEARLAPVDSAHLLWLPSTWAQALGRQGLLADFTNISPELHRKVSPDFLSSGDDHPVFIPVLWSTEKNALRVEGLALPHGGLQPSAAMLVVNDWLRAGPAMLQVKEVDAASCLSSLNERNLPYRKRARDLRDRNFRNLKVK